MLWDLDLTCSCVVSQMIMMTEMFSRIEANPKGELTAQDMEIAVTKALEQAVWGGAFDLLTHIN